MFVLVHGLGSRFQSVVSCLQLFESEAKQDIMEWELVREEAVHVVAPKQRKEMDRKWGEETKRKRREKEMRKKKRSKKEGEKNVSYSLSLHDSSDLLPPTLYSNIVFTTILTTHIIINGLVYDLLRKITVLMTIHL